MIIYRRLVEGNEAPWLATSDLAADMLSITSNIDLIDDVIAAVARRVHLRGPEADDFRQDAWLHILRREEKLSASFEGRRKVETFLFSVVFHFACSWLRRTRRRARDVLLNEDDVIGAVPGPGVADPERLRRHQAIWVSQLLTALPTKDREFLVACFSDGVQMEIVARRFGLTASAAYSRKYRLVRLLKELATTGGIDHEDVRACLREAAELP